MSGLGRPTPEQKKAADRAHEIVKTQTGHVSTISVPTTEEKAPKS
jgi:hypothetical protein